MRKSLWIMLAVLFVAISASNAQADSFTYNFMDPLVGISWTTAPISAPTTTTTVAAVDLTFTSNTGTFAGCMTADVKFAIDLSTQTGNVVTDVVNCPPSNTSTTVIHAGVFALSDFSTPGTYSSAGDTLVVTSAVAAPEPSSVALMLPGLGLVLLLRRRNSRGHQLAT